MGNSAQSTTVRKHYENEVGTFLTCGNATLQACDLRKRHRVLSRGYVDSSQFD